MSGERRRRLGNNTNPLIVVEWFISVSAIIGGLYLMSPVLRLNSIIHSNGAIAQAVTSDIGIVLVAAFAIFTGLLIVAGIIKRKASWRSAGLFLNGMLRLYALIAGILINGLLPLTWLSSAVLLCITLYIWGRIRRRGQE